MKPQCRANVEQAIGRPLVDGEEQFIDQQIIDHLLFGPASGQQFGEFNPTPTRYF